MRLLSILTAALLPAATLAAKTPEERFNAALAKGQPQKLTDISYDSLTKAPRDFSVAVLLTAQDARFGCQLCNEFQPEWELLAKSWVKGDKKKESRVVFGTLDFLDGKATFQSV
jgi:oligosaccharyltransferase complex subunit gamma